MHKLGLCIDDSSFGIEKYLGIIKLLVASGANIHTIDKYGTTLLHLAAEAGCVEMVRMLLEEKVKVNLCDENTNSPLALAIRGSGISSRVKDYLMVVNMLIEVGANVHHANKYNSNLLHIAIVYGNVEIVKLLIDHKVEINLKDNIGYTPLHVAVASNADSKLDILEQQCCLEVLDLLIQRGAIIDVENDSGYTPLQLAVRDGSGKLATYLIKQGANINPTNSHSLLHEAINACYSERKDAYIALIKYLISLGVVVNNADGQGNTPLHLAIKKLWVPGFQEVINLLIKAGADIYAINKDGNTPFFYMKPYIREILL